MDYKDIGKKLFESRKVIVGNDLNQLILLASQADFIKNDAEPIEVAAIIFYGIRYPNILPKISEQQGKELGAKCFISLSFFKSALEHLWRFHGAPNPKYYQDVGRGIFYRENMVELAENFERWNNYLFERFH